MIKNNRFLCVLAVLTSLMAPALAVDRLVLVANSGDGTVTVFKEARTGIGDPTIGSPRVIPTGKSPSEICLSPDGKHAYVTNRGETSVSILDLDSLKTLPAIADPAMKGPDGCTVSSDGSKLYVVAVTPESLFVFATADGHKLAEIRVGQEPRRVLLSPDNKFAYVSNGEDRNITIIDTQTNLATGKIKGGRDPRSMIFTPDGKYFAFSNVSDDTVQFNKLGSAEPEYIVGVPRSPQQLTAVPSKNLLVTVSRFDNALTMLDLRPHKNYGRYLGSIPVGRAPWAVALSSSGETLYVTNTLDNNISLIDLRMMRPGPTIPSGKAPLAIVVR